MTRFWFLAPVLACGIALASSSGARAGLLPVAVTVSPEASNYRWTYAIVLPTDSQLRPGNFFTIYDFRGYVPGTASAPPGWQFTLSNDGPTPGRVGPDDDPTLPNLSWEYVGPAIIPSGQVGLGNFWAVSRYSGETDSFFTAETNRSSDGKIDANITTTVVPVPAAVPEPTTLVLAGLGLPIVGLARRLRRRS